MVKSRWKSCNPLYHTNRKAWRKLCYSEGWRAFTNCKVKDLYQVKGKLNQTGYLSILQHHVILSGTWLVNQVLYTHLLYHNDSIIKTLAERRKKTSLTTYLPLTLLQGFERVVQGLHVRRWWRLNINFIFWPHCYDRHVVSFLFS